MKTISIVLATMLAATAGAATRPTSQPKAEYIAHEWGTFTSVQGIDGIQLEWNPFVAEELPKFVYNINRPTAKPTKPVLPTLISLSKSGILSRQRMETPVIYFYTNKPQTISVDVSFPGGMFTEWFPQLAPLAANTRPVPMRGMMRWNDVKILPGNGADETRYFPKDDGGSHYYAARETDASGVKVKGLDGSDEYEKFLFYRGVAQFEAPLRVTQVGERGDVVRLENRGTDPLGTFFIYSVRGGRAAFVKANALAPKSGPSEAVIEFEKTAKPLAEVRAELGREMRQALTSAGLYERESAAMVKTWDDSWFGEEGTRVLYLLPQKWSDSVLPLTFTPAPKEVKRVFVGRAELITPAQEWAVLKEVTRYVDGGSLERKAAVTAVSNLNLGRFTDAMARRLTQQGPQTKEYAQAVWSLLDATRPQPRTAATVAR